MYVREVIEGAKSAFKYTASQRDKVMMILDMAKRKEFDILVIYHSNRLGRLAEDTPRLITEFSRFGVRVFSVCDGELIVKTVVDRLMNNIRYFINESESELKSNVITDYQMAMVENGAFRGGSFIPLGYELIDNGSKNYKGRHILDYQVNEEEAEIVRHIFHLSAHINLGQQRIARKLNDPGGEYWNKTKSGSTWHSTTINAILHNIMYRGIFKFNSKKREISVYSDNIDRLTIIPDDLWDNPPEQKPCFFGSRVFPFLL